MKAYSKRLLLAAIIVPYIIQGMNEQGVINDIPTIQRVNVEANRSADEVEASLAEADQLATTLGQITGEILQAPLDELTDGFVQTLEGRLARLITSQLQILQTLNQQEVYEKHYQTVQNVSSVRNYQQRIQAQYDDVRIQADAHPSNEALQNDRAAVTLQLNEIGHLSQRLLAHRNRIEQAILTIQELAHRAVRLTTESIIKIRPAALQFAHQQGLSGQEQQARTITVQIITSLLEIEQHIKTLLNDELYIEALQGATVAQAVQNALRQITPDDIPAMQIREQQVQAAAEEVKNLIPIEPSDDEPADTQTPAGQPPVRPGQRPQPPVAPPTAPPQRTPPPVGPPGRALENIKKANLKLESAVHSLDVVKGYFNQIEATERTVVKKKAGHIFKEYESGLRKFADRIKQVKAENRQLDQAKLAPFNKFLELTDKLSARVKSL